MRHESLSPFQDVFSKLKWTNLKFLWLLPLFFITMPVWSQPVLVGSQTASVSSSNNSITINTPASSSTNDLLVAILTVDDDETIEVPAGWTQLFQGFTSGNTATMAAFYKIAGNSEPASFTFSWGSSENAIGAIVRYSGVDTANPITVLETSTGDSNNPATPAITTTADNSRILLAYGAAGDLGQPSNYQPAGTNPIFGERSNSTSIFAASIRIADIVLSTAGNFGSSNFDMLDSDNEEWRTIAMAIKPASSSTNFSCVSTEDFESATVGDPGVLPTDWLNLDEGTNDDCSGSGGSLNAANCMDWQVHSGATPSNSPIGPNNDHTTGSGKYIYYEDSGNNNAQTVLVSNSLNLSGLVSPRLEFWLYFHQPFSSTTDLDRLRIDIYNSAVSAVIASNVASFEQTPIADWVKVEIDLTPYQAQGSVRIAFNAIDQGDSNGNHDFSIDDFCLKTASTITISQNTQSACFDNGTSAIASDDYFQITFNATTTSSATDYEVVANANTNGTGGTVLNGTGTPFGTAVTVGSNTNPPFLANGTNTYTVTVREKGNPSSFTTYTTTPIAECSDCITTTTTTSNGTYRDEFNTVAYNNTNGTTNWTSAWTEFNDANGAVGSNACNISGFVIYVAENGNCNFAACPNNNNCLSFNTIAAGIGDYVSRQLDLSMATTATVGFDYGKDFVGGGDEVVFQIRKEGGTWTTLGTYNASVPNTGSPSFNIDTYLAADTEIRFLQTNATNAGSFGFDNIQVSYTTSTTTTTTGGPSCDEIADNTIATGGTVSSCTGTFADSGNLIANYGDNENHTLTLCSDANNHISLTFKNFNTEAGNDVLQIYDGNTTSATLIGAYSGSGSTNSPGVVTSSGTCLTFQFTSNATINSGGWEATISCTGTAPSSVTAANWNGYPSTTACANTAQLGGKVYEDINNDGTRDSREGAIRGVKVNLFDDNGQVGAETTTDANGDYTFNGLTVGTTYRVEFTIPDGYKEGAYGSGSGTSVQFAQSGQCDVNLGLLDPAHYCGNTNPFYAIPCYTNGDPQHSSNSNSTGVARFIYNDSGQSPAGSYVNYVTTGAIGSTWGIAYDGQTSKLYMASMLKRHVGLGPNGIGAIYVHQDGAANNSATLFYDFGAAAGTVASNASRFPGTGTTFGQEGPCGSCDNTDPTAFAKAGKVGFGDIEVSPDNTKLYVNNLHDRKVYIIDLDNPAPGSAVALSGMPWLDNSPCSNGVARPWALEFRNGKLYVGVVCDASSSSCTPGNPCADLTANVFSFDGTTWKNELTFPLDYYRDSYVDGSNYFVPWTDNWSQMAPAVENLIDANFAQPMISDIEIDDDGAMVIGLADRTGFQLGYISSPPVGPSSAVSIFYFSYGDILRAGYNKTTEAFTLENNGVVGTSTSTNPTAFSGPGGKSFYWGDYFTGLGAGLYQSGVGSLALLPGSGEVMFPIGDALDYFSNGISWMSSDNGADLRRLEIYQGTVDGLDPGFAKGAGVGDIALFCNPPPIEIGNIVWWDEDRDGLQDPSEPGIANVTVELWVDPNGVTQGNNPIDGTAVKVAETTTDAYGRYVFSYAGNNNSLNAENWSFTAANKVLPETFYQARIPNWETNPSIVAVRNSIGYTSHLLSPTQNQGATGTIRDNNAYDNPGNAGAAVRTGESGDNDHNFDFAFGGAGACDAPTVVPTSNTPCSGESINLVATVSDATAPYTYSWSGPNGFSSTDQNPVISDANAGVNIGIYSLTVTDALGCPDTVHIHVHINELTATISTLDANCGASDGSIDLTVSGGGPYTFDWSNDGVGDNNDPEDLSGLAAGNYSVTITAASGCTLVKNASIGSSGAVTLAETHVNETCGGSNASIDLTITGTPTSINWSTSQNIEDIQGLSAGTYSVTVNNAANCPASLTVEITDSPGPVFTVSKVNQLCSTNNGSIDITVNGGTAPYTFDWDNDGTGDNNDTEDLNNLASGNYNVTVYDANGCQFNNTITITNIPPPALSTTVVNETCGSANGSINLVVINGTAPYSYEWNGGQQIEDMTGLASGTYAVTVTDANGCEATTSATVLNSPLPQTTAVTTNTTNCDVTDGSINLTVNSGTAPFTFDWNNDGVGDNNDTEDLAGLGAGTYRVSATDANGCTSSLEVEVTSSSTPALSMNVTNPTTCDTNGAIDLTVTGGTGPYTYDWSNDGLGDNDDTEDLAGVESGTYSVIVSSVDGCTVQGSASISVIRNPVLTETITQPSCGSANGAITLSISDLDGTGPYTYDWSNDGVGDNDDSQNLTALSAGTYSLTVTNALNCTATASYSLSPLTAAASLTIIPTPPTCAGTNGSIDLTITGGTTPYTIDWDNDGTGDADDAEDLNNLSAGVYNVTVTSNNGCQSAQSVELISAPGPELSAIVTPEQCGIGNGSIDLNIAGIAPFLIDWNTDGVGDNDDQEDLSDLSEGPYTVQVTDANGCQNSTVANVTNQCIPCSVTLAQSVTPLCNDNGTSTNPADDYITFSLNPTGESLGSSYTVTANGGVTVTLANGNPATSASYGGPTTFRLPAGTANGTISYTITVTDNSDNACQTTTTVLQNSCSNDCAITSAGETLETCNNNNTSSDPTDDYITFSLNPTGNGLGSTYSATVNNGGTLTLVSGGAINNVSYGTATAFRLQNGSANGSTTYTITITDNTTGTCQTTTTVAQSSCSPDCSITEVSKTGEACNNSNTSSNAADDYIVFSLNPSGFNLGTSYSVTASGGATVSLAAGGNATNVPYGNVTAFRLQNGSATGTTYTITVTDNATGTCSTTTTVNQSGCSPVCEITSAGKTNESCNNNNTSSQAADDYITFSLNPTGFNLASNYTVSVNNGATVTLAGGGAANAVAYGTATAFRLQGGSANGSTTYTISIVDNNDASCSATTTVLQSSCSSDCELTAAGESAQACNNNSTASDGTDDYITFSLNPTGYNLGTTYAVTANNGASVSLSGGGNAAAVAYGAATAFRLQNGSANGTTYTITITDNSTGTCSRTITVNQNSCSTTCALLDAGETLETCNNSGTESDATDDYITFSLNPTGLNLGTSYTVTSNNSGVVSLASGGAATNVSYGSATAFRLQAGSANGSTTFMLTITDNTDGGCATVSTLLQNSCSNVCALTDAGKTLETCNNNTTVSLASDDYITFSLNPTGLNLSGNYTVTANNSGTVTLLSGGPASGVSYGSATAFRLQDGSANGTTTYTITITDNTDAACSATTTVLQNSCSTVCNLTDAGKTLETCNDNATVSNPADDYITFSLNPSGFNLGSNYTVTANNGATVTLAAGGAATAVNYGTATAFRLQTGSANGTTFTITITDNTDGACSITTTVNQNSCSTTCALTDAGESSVTCNDNGTVSNAADDYITFSLQPTGSNLGTTYTVTVDNGATVTLAGGGAATAVPYTSLTAFRLQTGTANGTTYTLTITDNTAAACSTTTTLSSTSCSNTCNLTSVQQTLESCNNNNTTSDVTDDYLTFTVNPTGSNLGGTYSVTANNGATVTLASGGAATSVAYGTATAFRLQDGTANGTTYTITISDNGSANCDISFNTVQNSCSPVCLLANANKTLETCNDAGSESIGTDDYISFSLNPSGLNLGATYSVTANNGATVTLANGNPATGIAYGAATTFRLQNGSANGTSTYTITVTDVSDANCTTTTTVSQPSCSATCSLTAAGKSSETCNDNGTPSVVPDDYITFSLNPSGLNLSTTYTVTVDNGATVTLANGSPAAGINYGAITAFRLQGGSADGATTYTITITDDADGVCSQTTTVMQSACSNTCQLTDINEILEICNNNNTNSDASDDYITFSLNPVGLNLGATYSVTTNNGGTVSLAGGGAATGIAYGSITALRLQAGSANGTAYTITVTDVASGACTITTGVSQNACSNTCQLTDAGKSSETCNDNTTVSDGTDDYITFSLNPTGLNLGASYAVSVNNGATVTLANGNPATAVSYGNATAFRLQSGSANGATTYTITVTDVSDPACVITTTVLQDACSTTCDLTDATKTLETCNDNGTTSDPSDDYVTFQLNPVGVNLGATYSVTANNGATVTLSNGNAATGVVYGAATTFRLQNGSANGTSYTITVVDVASGACSITTTVQQNACSNTCQLTDAGESFETCNNNGTVSDPSDDYITFNLAPVGLNLSTSYSVTANNGATITLADGSAATSVPYGVSTAFRLQNGSANGATTYTVTILDGADPNCTTTTTVSQSSCSNTCALTDIGKTLEICNNSTTSSDATDDYITFSLNPSGLNLGTSYSVTVDNGATVTLASGAAATAVNYGAATSFRLQDGSANGGTTYTITVTDNTSGGCVITTTVLQSSCSNSCALTDAGKTLEVCNNNNTSSDTSDDYITFSLNPVGVNLGTTYSVFVNNGGVVTQASGVAATGINYGTATAFRLQNASADGAVTFTITVIDDSDGACATTTTVLQNSCSDACNLTDAGKTLESCNDAGTSSEGTDDYITFSLNPEGANLGSSYTLTADNGGIITLISGGAVTTVPYGVSTDFRLQDGSADGATTFTITITDNTDAACSVVTTVAQSSCVTAFYDWGDLPDNSTVTGTGDYQTTESNNGPRHLINTAIFLGDGVDSEQDGQQSTLADGDNNNGASNDEQGLTFPGELQLAPGGTVNLPLKVTNTTGLTGYVEMWIDWNGDGDFADVNEQVANLSGAATGTFPATLPITIPSDVASGQLLGVRIRLSNQDNMTPYGLINSGEVEDYLITIICEEKCIRLIASQ